MTSVSDQFYGNKAKWVSGTVQSMFTGVQASDWVIKIKDRTCSVEEGKTIAPDLTTKLDAEDGVNMLTGKLEPMRFLCYVRLKSLEIWRWG